MAKQAKKKNFNIEELSAELFSVQQEIKKLKAKESQIKDEVYDIYADQATSAYKEKPEPFGIVSFKEGDLKISFDTPKKVSWDQAGLAEVFEEGGPVEVEYNVKENIYKALDDKSRKYLLKYRTVTPGNIAVKIESDK